MTLVKKTNNAPARGILGNFFNDEDFFNFPTSRLESRFANMPAVNISENDDQHTVELAVPGMKREDFKVEVENDTLTISTEAKNEKEEKTDNYTRREFSYHSFRRSFTLPENTVDTENINAKYENGVLYVSLPKKEEAKPKPARMIDIA